jgi:endonuclease/exonuclease/phosphatase family metal-dependent hydrolase
MTRFRRGWPIAAAVCLAACVDSTAITDLTGVRAPAHSFVGTRVDAMTRNLYIGADVFPVFDALATEDPNDDVAALLAAIAESQITAFPARVQALADEIATARPHVIGLQEVSIVDVQLPPFGLQIDLDYLAMLQDALHQRGLRYVVAAQESYSGVDIVPGPGMRIRNVDRDVLLIDASRVRMIDGSAFGSVFANNVGEVGGGLSLTRGYVGARVAIDGVEVTVVNTHLESLVGEVFNRLRAAQAAEVLAVIGSASPALILGDLNDIPGSLMHELISASGFRDAWGDLRPGVVGLTCCHRSDLSNQTAHETFSERIDYVFVRGLTHSNGKLLGNVTLHGMSPGDRVTGPAHLLWPSDHAGLSAALFTPPHD